MQSQSAAPGRGYTFGDTDLAARRLEVLGEVFGPSSRALLADVVERPPRLAYDLGCGPGYTTALLSQVTRARRTAALGRRCRPGVATQMFVRKEDRRLSGQESADAVARGQAVDQDAADVRPCLAVQAAGVLIGDPGDVRGVQDARRG